VKIESSKKKSSSKGSTSKKSARGAQAEPRAFVPPVLIDLVDVATTTRPRSSKSKRNR
jgi:hypothetical protein